MAMGGLGGRLSSTAIFSVQQSRTIQILATVCAAVSVLSTLITLYQLLMLKRNFRRSLILLLIVGDFFKSIWYLVFASTALSVGGIKTSSDFCQANGFLLQTSIEACGKFRRCGSMVVTDKYRHGNSIHVDAHVSTNIQFLE